MPSQVPALPAFHVARPRLLDLLDAGGEVPLTAVVAPPGAGKSITLAAWIHDRCPDAVWVPCTERDRDPVVFLGHVAVALRAAQGDRWLDAVELLGERDPDPEDAVDAILKELEDGTAVIVLDDVHVAREARAVLSRLVEHLPAGSRVVTGSRGDPPLAIHRLRAGGRCLEVREADLRLTHDEVDELVRALGAGLSTDATRILSERANGWAAGVQMAAIALRDEADPDRFLAEFSGSSRIVSDYLVEEVLARQTEAVQRFLLRTSVLDELEPGACAAVTGHDDAATHPPTARHLGVVRRPHRQRHLPLPRAVSGHASVPALGDEPRRARGTAHRRAAEWYEGCGTIASTLDAPRRSRGRGAGVLALLQAELVQMTMRGGASPRARAAIAAVSDSDPTLDADRMVTIGFAFSVVARSRQAMPGCSGRASIRRARRRRAAGD